MKCHGCSHTLLIWTLSHSDEKAYCSGRTAARVAPAASRAQLGASPHLPCFCKHESNIFPRSWVALNALISKQHKYVILTFHEREDFLGWTFQPVSQPVSLAQWPSVRAGHRRRTPTFQKASFMYSLSKFASQCIGKRKEEKKSSVLQWRVSWNSFFQRDLHMNGDIFT